MCRTPKPFTTFKLKIETGMFIVFILFLGGSCTRWSLGDPGPIRTTFRPIGDCQTVQIGQKFDVFLLNDTQQTQGYYIEYPEKLLPHIEHEISNHVLRIRDNNQAKWTQELSLRPKVTLNLHRYEQLQIEGSSTWRCLDTLHGKQLRLYMNSAMNQDIWIHCNELLGKCQNIGSLALSGIGTIFSFTMESGGQLDARRLSCHDAYIWHFTKRNCWVSPERQAFVKLYNSGNLFMKQQTFFRKEISEQGTGRVIFEP
jgi:hypothetical protein